MYKYACVLLFRMGILERGVMRICQKIDFENAFQNTEWNKIYMYVQEEATSSRIRIQIRMSNKMNGNETWIKKQLEYQNGASLKAVRTKF